MELTVLMRLVNLNLSVGLLFSGRVMKGILLFSGRRDWCGIELGSCYWPLEWGFVASCPEKWVEFGFSRWDDSQENWVYSMR